MPTAARTTTTTATINKIMTGWKVHVVTKHPTTCMIY